MYHLRVKGELACFARPELKVETVTYDVPTPTACIGIFSAIYRKPEMEWVIDSIQVLNQIRTFSQMTNGVTKKASVTNPVPIDSEKFREQRNTTILFDVDYIITAHFNIVSGENNPGKHSSIFMRRALKGQCFHHPYLGQKKFAAHSAQIVHPRELDNIKPHPSLLGEKDLGLMLYSIDYDTNTSSYFRAKMVDGFIEIPTPKDKRVLR